MRQLRRLTQEARPGLPGLAVPPDDMKRLTKAEALYWAGALNALFEDQSYVITWAQEINNFYPRVTPDVQLVKPCSVIVDNSDTGIVVIQDTCNYSYSLNYEIGIATESPTFITYEHARHGFIVVSYTLQRQDDISQDIWELWRRARKEQSMRVDLRTSFGEVAARSV